MLPLASRPALDYILKEVRASCASGLTLVESPIVVSNKSKQNLNQFAIESGARLAWQESQLGLLHAVSLGFYSRQINSPSLLVSLPDNILWPQNAEFLPDLIAPVLEGKAAAVIAVSTVSEDKFQSYGMVSLGHDLGDQLFKVNSIEEKPKCWTQAPVAIIGRYAINADVFGSILNDFSFAQKIEGEFTLTCALQNHMIEKGLPVFAKFFKGQFLDVGTPDLWLKANLLISQN